MNETPFFSIITVTLNNLAGLYKTFNSLKQQSLTDYEWIVVDGASKDGTADFLAGLEMDALQWTSEPDEGLYYAMNKGITISSGAYLLFLNAGDEMADKFVLEHVRNAIEKARMPKFIYGDAYQITREGDLFLKKAYHDKRAWYGMFTHHQAMFFYRGGVELQYNTEFTYASDYDFALRYLQSNASVLRVLFPICKFESGGISQTGSTAIADREQWIIRQRVLRYPWLVCAAIHILHKIILVIRRLSPMIYRCLRFSSEREGGF